MPSLFHKSFHPSLAKLHLVIERHLTAPPLGRQRRPTTPVGERKGFVVCVERFTFGGKVQTQIVLIDYENVQPSNVGVLRGKSFQIKLFVGANQKNIPVELARELHALGASAEYLRIQGNGRNALDFHIAYYIGCLSAEFPHAVFHIVSKDTGFDPLIAHLKERHIACHRSPSLADVLAVKHPALKAARDRVAILTENLVKLGSSKPRTLKTLTRWIKAQLGSQVSDEEAGQLVGELAQDGLVVISDGRVTYRQGC